MNDRSKDYVFVSYAHRNDISGILRQFQSKGYNLVYDKSMSYGEEWDLNARRYVQSEKCKGVLVVLTKESVTSKPVLKEMEYARQFKKNYIPVMRDNTSVTSLCNSLEGTLDANKEYIMRALYEFFPPELLYINARDIDWEKLAITFDKWNFKSDSSVQPIVAPHHFSDIPGEKTRLNSQQFGYNPLDMRVLGEVLHTFDRDGLCVLDLGCSDGNLTISRFAPNARIKKVIGVDCNARDIEEARTNALPYGDKFSFYVVDLESEDVIPRLTDILRENGIEKVDIVFSALVLHHLKNPRLLLLKLYEIFGDDGKIILRGSDDGGKLCYPHSELLEEILDRYGKVVTTSDRSNGRKLYGQLYNTGYTNIRMIYNVVDTCEKDRKNRSNMFKVGFDFRLNILNHLVRLNPDNEFLKSEKSWLENAIAKFREYFYQPDFWYAVTSYVAIAEVR